MNARCKWELHLEGTLSGMKNEKGFKAIQKEMGYRCAIDKRKQSQRLKRAIAAIRGL